MYDEQKTQRATANQGQAPSSFAPAGLASQVAAQGASPGGYADQSPSGSQGPVGMGDEGATPRDQAAGAPEQQQQQQSAAAMQDISTQFQGLVATAQQLTEQVGQMAQAYPAAGEALKPVLEGIEQIKQVLLQSMVAAVQSIQAAPITPPQV